MGAWAKRAASTARPMAPQLHYSTMTSKPTPSCARPTGCCFYLATACCVKVERRDRRQRPIPLRGTGLCERTDPKLTRLGQKGKPLSGSVSWKCSSSYLRVHCQPEALE